MAISPFVPLMPSQLRVAHGQQLQETLTIFGWQVVISFLCNAHAQQLGVANGQQTAGSLDCIWLASGHLCPLVKLIPSPLCIAHGQPISRSLGEGQEVVISPFFSLMPSALCVAHAQPTAGNLDQDWEVVISVPLCWLNNLSNLCFWRGCRRAEGGERE